MTRSCCLPPSVHGIAQVILRALGWMAAVATLIILAFIINQWPDKGGAAAAGLVGSGIAILNDSWVVISSIDVNLGFARLSPARCLLHDLFSLAISLGGIVMIIFSRYTYDSSGVSAVGSSSISASGSITDPDVISRQGFSQHSLLALGVWMLTTIIIFRFIFIVLGCFDCFTEYREYNARVRLAMEEANHHHYHRRRRHTSRSQV